MASKPQLIKPAGDRAQPLSSTTKGNVATPPVSRPRRPRAGPFEFLSQVRSEGEKVTWPSRKETLITAAMVFVLVVVASVFFLITDFVLQKLVGLVLGIGG